MLDNYKPKVKFQYRTFNIIGLLLVYDSRIHIDLTRSLLSARFFILTYYLGLYKLKQNPVVNPKDLIP